MNNTFIISSDCPTGPAEILNNGKAGYIFRVNDKKDFIQKYPMNEELVGKVVDKDKLHRKYQYRKHYTGVTRTIF